MLFIASSGTFDAIAAEVNQASTPAALDEKGRAAYAEFLTKPPNRAFAVGENGAYFFASGRDSRTQAARVALYGCNKAAQNVCRIHAINDDLVYASYAEFEQSSKALLEELRKETFNFSAYGNEAQDFSVASPEALRKADLHAPTPLSLKGVQTVQTVALVKLMTGANPPIIIDVLGGDGHKTLPGAYWIRGAGWATNKDETNATILERFGLVLSGLTKGDKATPLVFLCLDSHCWLSYNAALRARDLGYTNLGWYRGGNAAWGAARLGSLDAVEHGSVF